MKSSVWTLLTLLWLVLPPAAAAWSARPEDLEASGDDLEMDGSGSGFGSGGGEVIEDEKPILRPKDSPSSAKEPKSAPNNVSQEPEVQPWDREAILLEESVGFMENREIIAGVIAGGVGGLLLALVLGALLIYKWQKKDPPGYVRGSRQDTSWYVRGSRQDTSWYVRGHSQDPSGYVRGSRQDPSWYIQGHKQEQHPDLSGTLRGEEVVLV